VTPALLGPLFAPRPAAQTAVEAAPPVNAVYVRADVAAALGIEGKPGVTVGGAPGRLYYWRCADCLDPVTVREKVTGPLLCGACGGSMEYLGRVARDRLVVEAQVCACDHRCTGAIGPMCDCHCGGVNHGTGREVTVIRDAGPVPRLSPQRDAARLRQRAEEYRRLRGEAEAALLARGYHPERAKLEVRYAAAGRTVKGRNSALLALIGGGR